MGNLFTRQQNFYSQKKLFDISHKETWIYITQFLDLQSLAQFARVSKDALEVWNNDLVWLYKSKSERNFQKIKQLKELLHSNWKNAYLMFQYEFIQSLEILIGDRNQPEGRVLIQLLGSGKCYISEKFYLGVVFSDRLETNNKNIYYIPYNGIIYKMVRLNEYNSPLYCLEDDIRTITKYIPYSSNRNKWKHIKNERLKLNNDRIVEISSYDPYVLLLTEQNKVFEFAVYPESESNVKEGLIPTEVIIPSKDPIFKIKATKIGNFVLTQNSNDDVIIFVWTDVNKNRSKVISLDPILEYKIYDLEVFNDITEMYYMKNGKKETLKIRNEELMLYIITEFR